MLPAELALSPVNSIVILVVSSKVNTVEPLFQRCRAPVPVVVADRLLATPLVKILTVAFVLDPSA